MEEFLGGLSEAFMNLWNWTEAQPFAHAKAGSGAVITPVAFLPDCMKLLKIPFRTYFHGFRRCV
jgi:hypothetical protein